MNCIDILVIIIVVIIFGLVIFFTIRNKSKGPCSSCPAIKHYKKDLKKAKKEILDKKEDD